MFDEVIKYLIEHLHIEIEQTTEMGPYEKIQVRLLIGENVISESECHLPDPGD